MAANPGRDDPPRPPGGDKQVQKRKSGESPEIAPCPSPLPDSLEDIEEAQIRQALKLSWDKHIRSVPRLNRPESRQVRVGEFFNEGFVD